MRIASKPALMVMASVVRTITHPWMGARQATCAVHLLRATNWWVGEEIEGPRAADASWASSRPQRSSWSPRGSLHTLEPVHIRRDAAQTADGRPIVHSSAPPVMASDARRTAPGTEARRALSVRAKARATSGRAGGQIE